MEHRSENDSAHSVGDVDGVRILIKAEVTPIALHADDVIVIRLEHAMTEKAALAHMAQVCRTVFPGHRVVYLEPGVSIDVVRPDQVPEGATDVE